MKSFFSLLLLLCCGFPLQSFAQTALKRPLAFVPAQQILVIDPTEDNVVQRAMAVSPFLTPRTPELVADSVKHYRRLLKQSPTPASLSTHTLEQLFLLSGDARYMRPLDSLRTVYDAQQRTDSTSRSAAQRLLSTLGWVAAAEGRNVYINLAENCLIPITTAQLKVSLDQIYQDGRVKFRVSGLSSPDKSTGRTRFALRLLLPTGVNPQRIFLNGHRLLDPQWERGYLIIDRDWRNMEEVYYELPGEQSGAPESL